MINPFKETNWRPEQEDLRRFGRSLIIGFPCLALFFFVVAWTRAGHLPPPQHYLMTGAAGVLVGLLIWRLPRVGKPLYLIWYGISACIGFVTSNLLLTVIYYLVLTPVALFLRLRGRDILRLKWNRAATTYWHDAPPPPPPSDYFRQY